MTLPLPLRSRRSAVSLVAAVTLTTALLAACGDDDEPAAAANVAAAAEAAETGYSTQTSAAAARTALFATMNGLWAQHMQWTYATVDAFANNPKALKPTMDRLLANQQDIGDAVGSFYGAEAGQTLADLLTTHIEQAVPVLTAAKAGKQTDLDKALKDWYANAQDIADFLAQANPDAWPQDTVRKAMKGHITQTVAYAGDLIKGNHKAAITKYDAAEKHMLELADILSNGVIAAFPDKF